jgi:hypothetical protein
MNLRNIQGLYRTGAPFGSLIVPFAAVSFLVDIRLSVWQGRNPIQSPDTLALALALAHAERLRLRYTPSVR